MLVILQKTIILGLFIIPFIPLIVIDTLYFPFITGKAFTFRILIEILFCLWVILIVYEPKYRPRFSWLLIFIVGFLVTIGISDIFAADVTKAFWSNFERMEGYITLLHLFAYFLIISTVLRSSKLWAYFSHTWLGVGFYLFLYGLEQALGEFQNHLSGDRIDATLGNSTYLAGIGLFLVFLSIYFIGRNRDRLTQLLYTYSLGAGMFIICAFFSYSDRLSKLVQQSGGIVSDETKVSFFIGSGQLTLFLLSIVILGVSLYLYINQKKFSLKVLHWIHPIGYSLLALFFFVMILLTRTRGAIIGVIGGLSLTVLLIALFARARPKLQRVMAGLALVGVLMGGMLVAMVVTNTAGTTQTTPVVREVHSVLQGIPGLARVSNIELNETTVRSRFIIWRMSSNGFMEKPLFGWGQGNFYQVFDKYYDPRMYDQEPWFDRAHNIVFDWLIAGGLVGFLMYLGIIISGLGYLWYNQDRGPFQRLRGSMARVMRSLTFFEQGEKVPTRFTVVDSSIFTGLFAGYIFHNIFVFDNITSYLLFFTLLGFIYVVNTPRENMVVFGTKEVPERYRMAVVPLMLIVCIGIVYVVNVKPIQASQNLIQSIVTLRSGNYQEGVRLYKKTLNLNTFGNAETRSALGGDAISYIKAENTDESVKEDIFIFASSEFEKQLQETPLAVRTYMSYGSLLLSRGNVDEALKMFEKAHELSPRRQDMYFNIAHVHLLKGEADRALEILKEGFYLEPENFQAREYYMYAGIAAGNEEAIQEALTYEGDYVKEMALSNLIVTGYLETKQWDKAVELMDTRIGFLTEEIQKTRTEDSIKRLVSAYEMYANVYLQKGEKSKAVQILQTAIQAIPEAKIHFESIISQIQKRG